jgi:rubredoxin
VGSRWGYNETGGLNGHPVAAFTWLKEAPHNFVTPIHSNE